MDAADAAPAGAPAGPQLLRPSLIGFASGVAGRIAHASDQGAAA